MASMQLVSINVEGERHIATVTAFLAQQDPDVICLQECPQSLADYLRGQDYHVTFETLTIRERDARKYNEGILVATRQPHISEVVYYYREHAHPVVFKKSAFRNTNIKAVIFVEVAQLCIATTHFTWTPNGAVPNAYQKQDIKTLMSYLDSKPPHIICGDFNIPRGYNELYDTYLAPRYIDEIPSTYLSSLDPTLHRLGTEEDKQHVFTDFMVDYIFARSPLRVRDVSLTFGVSDHAAVSGTIVV